MYLLLPFIAVCLYTDLSERKIYNNVVLAGIIVSLIYNVIVLGPLNGAVFTFTGLFTGIFLLIIPYVAGGLGAGDVKMLGMIGAFLGYSMVVEVLLVSALVGGIFAVVTLIRGKGILLAAEAVMEAYGAALSADLSFICSHKNQFTCTHWMMMK
jgi:prepilin peptidase CpaA